MMDHSGFSRTRTARHFALAPVFVITLFAVVLASAAALAGEVDVLAVEAEQAGDGSWRFSVTVEHADEGWSHYADLWEVVGPDGTVLGERVLAHPHVDEQPFTRSLAGVAVPKGVDTVTVRARDSVHGFGGAEMTVDLRSPRAADN